MKKNKLAQIVAIIGIVVLIVMVIATLVVGFMNFENKDRVFMALIFSDIVVPVFLYFFLMIIKRDRKDIEEYVKSIENQDTPDENEESEVKD